MIKTNGAMFKEFMNDNEVWKEGAYFDDDVIIIKRNSKQFSLELLEDLDTLNDDEVKIYGGTYYPNNKEDSTEKAQSIIKVFNNWLKSRNKVKVLIEIDKDKISLIKEYILSIGGNILN